MNLYDVKTGAEKKHKGNVLNQTRASKLLFECFYTLLTPNFHSIYLPRPSALKSGL